MRHLSETISVNRGKRSNRIMSIMRIKLMLVLCIISILYIQSRPVLGAIRIEPDMEVAGGTMINVIINLANGRQSVNLRIVRDVNGTMRADKGDEVIKTIELKDGIDGAGGLKDNSGKAGVIEFQMVLDRDFVPGRYIFREEYEKGEPANGYCLKVVEQRGRKPARLGGDEKGMLKWVFPLYVWLLRDDETGEEAKPSDLWLMDAETHKIISRLTKTGDCIHPAMSQDGKRVAYVRSGKDKSELWTLTVENGGTTIKTFRVLAGNGRAITSPLWSPGGDRIVFLRSGEIRVVNADGTDETEIPFGGTPIRLLAWLPGEGGTQTSERLIAATKPVVDIPVLESGGKIRPPKALGAVAGDKLEIWKVEPSTGVWERLEYDNTWLWYPYLSPGGERMVFPVKSSWGGQELRLRQLNVEKEPKRLSFGGAPTWSPEGERIVFVAPPDVREKNARFMKSQKGEGEGNEK